MQENATIFDYLSLKITDSKGQYIPEPKLVVRVSTSCWSDNNGLYVTKSIRRLKRKSSGDHVLFEDISNVGADETLNSFINFDGIKDGIYEVRLCNIGYDDGYYGTGCIDSWNYKLVKYEEI